MKTYLFDHKERTEMGGFPVYIGRKDENGKVLSIEELSPVPSQAIQNHSPDGFNWGYCGSGPAQCALGILLDVTGDRNRALNLYQQFKEQVIAHIRETSAMKVEIEESSILKWLNENERYYWRKYTLNYGVFNYGELSPERCLYDNQSHIFSDSVEGAKRQAVEIVRFDVNTMKGEWDKWGTSAVTGNLHPGYTLVSYLRRTEDIRSYGRRARYSYMILSHFVRSSDEFTRDVEEAKWRIS